MFAKLYALFLTIWRLLTAPFRAHPCTQCTCTDYTDEALFTWMKQQSHKPTYADEMLAERLVGKPLVCSLCTHARQSHGTLQKRLLSCDAMPNGGAVLNEMLARQRLARRERRFHPAATGVSEVRPSVVVEDVRVGDGMTVRTGATVMCHYDAFLKSSMEKFECSRTDGTPVEVTLGVNQVVPGWEKGLPGVRVGGKRRLIVPPELAYRSKSINGERNATIVFDIEILAVLSSD